MTNPDIISGEYYWVKTKLGWEVVQADQQGDELIFLMIAADGTYMSIDEPSEIVHVSRPDEQRQDHLWFLLDILTSDDYEEEIVHRALKYITEHDLVKYHTRGDADEEV